MRMVLGRRVVVAGVVAALALLAVAAVMAQRRGGRFARNTETLPQGSSEAEKRILGVLAEMARQGETYLNVPVADGRMMRLLLEASGARSVVEIGTSTGYSGLWLMMALQKTGGKLTTFELDPGRAATARANFRKAGVEQMVTVVEGDGHQTVSRLKEPVDAVFIDADKEGYVDYLKKTLPLVRSGGLILAHNVSSADAYVQAVNSDASLETVFYMDGGGLSITLKKR